MLFVCFVMTVYLIITLSTEHLNFVSVVTITSGLISYPIDTIRRRMMMTSGQAVKYSGSIDCTKQILKNEGAMSFMKGAGKLYIK